MLKNLFNKLSNTLLFYVDKSGKSVFRNYCLLHHDGYLYEDTFSIQTAGKALEYRMELDKKLNILYCLITIAMYLIFINIHFSFFNFILIELLWIILIFACRFIARELYSRKIVKLFGQYQLTEFRPPVSKEKTKMFQRNFISKLIIIFILTLIFFMPAFLLYGIVKADINSKKPHFKFDIALSNIYKLIYPKIDKIYDMSAYAKYQTENYEGAIKDYKHLLNFSGKNFDSKDYTRFANLMYLHKKLHGSQMAVDIFNEYATKKKMSILEQTQMLWIKSMFSIHNNITEFIPQEYDDLLLSLKEKDLKNKFYISSDKAYMMYLIGYYQEALEIYNELIKFAQENEKDFSKELPRLYIERGFTKKSLNDKLGADDDFVKSGINMYEVQSYEPKVGKQGFIIDKF